MRPAAAERLTTQLLYVPLCFVQSVSPADAAAAASDHVDELRALGRIGADEVDADALDPAAALAALTPAARDALVPRRVALFVEPSPFTYGAHAR